MSGSRQSEARKANAATPGGRPDGSTSDAAVKRTAGVSCWPARSGLDQHPRTATSAVSGDRGPA